MDVKLIEIHDRATFVPAMAMRVTGSQENLPPPRRDQLVSRTRFFAHFAQWQCQPPDHPRTAKTPCSPETLIEMEFPQAMVGALSRRSPRPQG